MFFSHIPCTSKAQAVRNISKSRTQRGLEVPSRWLVSPLLRAGQLHVDLIKPMLAKLHLMA